LTFQEIVDEVMNRLNLSSQDARDRISKRVNTRYRRVTTLLGLTASRFIKTTYTVNVANFPVLPDMRIEMENVTRVIRLNDTPTVQVLRPTTYDELTSSPTYSRLPDKWAIKEIGNNFVIITLDAFPTGTDFTLAIEGYRSMLNLQDNDEPLFPESFHDILVEGVMADEHRKMEKPQLAEEDEAKYALILSDLKYYVAKTIYQDVYQGKTRPRQRWYWPWTSRVQVE